MAWNHAILVLALASIAFACDQWPNNTQNSFNWWQCSGGPVTFYNATPHDDSGAYEYPVHLSKPLYVNSDVNSPNKVYSNLREDVRIWQWDTNKCAWSEVPTLGLLSNLDACSNGVTCPVQTGRQWLDVKLDFTKYSAIINLLKNDWPYQLEYKLTDRDSSDVTCVTAQAHAYTK